MDYKSTLNLPKTDFPMKAQLPQREGQFLARWQQEDLYGQIRKARQGAEAFILHDGPPYANGGIHIGHALNKILKDIIIRYKTLRGFDAPYVPGWDCHGMPIEHQLFKDLKLTKHQVSQTEFRQQARAYAQRYVDIQREQFKQLGVLGDWQRPYLTMAPEYEQTILRVFRELLEAGYISRGKKPVYWCATCETALAEAEVEYEDRQDTSIYLRFPVIKFATEASVPTGLIKQGLAVAVWTTTPWTLPANVALCFHPTADYVALSNPSWSAPVIVAAALADRVAQVLGGTSLSEIWRGNGRLLSGLQVRGPFRDTPSVGVLDDNVSMEEGTGVVHIAPGHGHEDYLIGQREKLETLSPVDHQGRFTKDVPTYARQTVFEANSKIIADLKARGLLLQEELLTHSYPHCWRCKQPVIFRATPQWFLTIEHRGLRQRLLQAARQVTWIPDIGLNRIAGMLETRPDWCLSRQRYWGTPIPVLHCKTCQQPLTDAKIMREIEATLAARGMDAWFSLSANALAPGATCSCGSQDLEQDRDILDVWFDSGVSHEAVLKQRQGLRWPASLYLEGSDQHRGWFQVSLIPSTALHDRAPYERVLTHGFVMDGEGRKMSKSLGNVIAPQDVMQRYGADILRLWVASCDYREDVRISEDILAQVAESYRKIRNTFRYLLANLYDYDPRGSAPDFAQFPEIDRWAYHRLCELHAAVEAAYEAYQFHEVVRAVYHYCVVDLSAFYLDALKDRLYTEASSSRKRRCAQQVLYAILGNLVRMLAPILAVTSEEIWQLMQTAGWVDAPSVHLATWPQRGSTPLSSDERQRWGTFLSMRTVVMKALEEERARGIIGSPLEARVTLVVGEPSLRRACETYREALTEAFVVSDVVVQADGARAGGTAAAVPGVLDVRVERAPGEKCSRCWKRLTSVGQHPSHPHLCARCAAVVTR